MPNGDGSGTAVSVMPTSYLRNNITRPATSSSRTPAERAVKDESSAAECRSIQRSLGSVTLSVSNTSETMNKVQNMFDGSTSTQLGGTAAKVTCQETLHSGTQSDKV